jgi:NAD-dependent SIR2 family protein deacetylase
MQCLDDCGIGIFPSEPFAVAIDEATMRAIPPLPACPRCGALARPNVLMFGDWGWDSSRTDPQHRRMDAWLRALAGARLVIVELGAGKAVPTVRITCEDIARRCRGTLIRINLREPDVPAGHLSLPRGALDALRAISGRGQGPVHGDEPSGASPSRDR